nr:mitochondrial assembly of ribosomal large subunit protein 1 [Leptinotarsa decemlineata]
MFTKYFRQTLKLNSIRACVCNNNVKNYSNHSNDLNSKESSATSNKLGNIGSKYQIFHDQDAEVILDVYEERLKYSNLIEDDEVEESTPFAGINLNRGKSGVFEIEDLVDVLKRENAINIFVAKVPQEIKYVDYICIVSGKSKRHMQAVAQFVRRVFKQKRNQGDKVPKLEGELSNDWMALDLGNIALHIFSQEARITYDLDSLWAVGPEYDDEFNKPEPISEMLDMHARFLSDVQQLKLS